MASAIPKGSMVDTIPSTSFDGNAARDTLPPEPRAEEVDEAPSSRPFAIRARVPLDQSVEAIEEPDWHGDFIADRELADMLFQKRVRRVGPGLIKRRQRIYALHNAVRIVGRCGGRTSDPYGLLGTVESFAELVRAGARFSGSDMHLGSVVYRVERGVMTFSRDDER